MKKYRLNIHSNIDSDILDVRFNDFSLQFQFLKNEYPEYISTLEDLKRIFLNEKYKGIYLFDGSVWFSLIEYDFFEINDDKEVLKDE